MKGDTITMIKPGMFGKNVPADNRRMDFDFGNEQILFLKKRPDILFIGDSITQLWDIHAYFETDKFLVNRGIGGDCSTYLLKRFDADCIQLKPKKVILMIGTNDIARTADDVWWRTKGEAEETVLSDYMNNIKQIVKKCDDSGTELILCSVIPSDIAAPFDKEKRWRMTAKMNEFLKGLGKQYIDYHSVLTKDGKTLPYDLSPDGIHPNAEAYAMMAEVLKKNIEF